MIVAENESETNVTRTPGADQVRQFKDLMGLARENRSDANASAGEAREILKGLGYGAASIAMYKRLADMGPETAMAIFTELCQLLNADPDFDLQTAQPDLFADAQVKEAKGNGGRKRRKSSDEALADAQEHLGGGVH